jgi:SAM-dependent methyltransferase
MKEVSEIDQIHLDKTRENVRQLILNASSKDCEKIKVLDIAPQIHKGAKEFFQLADIFTLDLNPKSGADYIADICEVNTKLIKDETFDIIFCTEVLEHTLNPFNAVSEIFRILKKGGECYFSTPYNFRIHGPLPDCWRFTEHGLRVLFTQFEKTQINPLETPNRFLMPIHYTGIAIK